MKGKAIKTKCVWMVLRREIKLVIYQKKNQLRKESYKQHNANSTQRIYIFVGNFAHEKFEFKVDDL